MLQRGAANGRGDGLLMAIAAGAATAGLSKFYGHVHMRCLSPTRLWPPAPELDGVAASSLVVRPDGNRIADEGLGGISIANALARLDDPACATLICTAAIWDGPAKAGRIPANPFLERFGGELIRAESMTELAAKSGIPAAPLLATVPDYSDAGRRRTKALRPAPQR